MSKYVDALSHTVRMTIWEQLYFPSTSITPIKQGNTIREIGDELLEALTGAYKEAVGKPIAIEQVGG
jgi:hypothetical protein